MWFGSWLGAIPIVWIFGHLDRYKGPHIHLIWLILSNPRSYITKWVTHIYLCNNSAVSSLIYLRVTPNSKSTITLEMVTHTHYFLKQKISLSLSHLGPPRLSLFGPPIFLDHLIILPQSLPSRHFWILIAWIHKSFLVTWSSYYKILLNFIY